MTDVGAFRVEVLLAIALLFATERGRELRGAIADLTARGIDQTATVDDCD